MEHPPVGGFLFLGEPMPRKGEKMTPEQKARWREAVRKTNDKPASGMQPQGPGWGGEPRTGLSRAVAGIPPFHLDRNTLEEGHIYDPKQKMDIVPYHALSDEEKEFIRLRRERQTEELLDRQYAIGMGRLPNAMPIEVAAQTQFVNRILGAPKQVSENKHEFNFVEMVRASIQPKVVDAEVVEDDGSPRD
jgi:hypothetical protein